MAELSKLLGLFVRRGRRKFTRLPCEKTPLTLFFTPDRQEAEDAVGLACSAGGFHVSTPALQCDAGGRESEVALLKLNHVVFRATAIDALNVRTFRINNARGMCVTKFIGEDCPEPFSIRSQSSRDTLVIRGAHGGETRIIRSLKCHGSEQYDNGKQGRFHGSGMILKSLKPCKSFYAVVPGVDSPGNLDMHGVSSQMKPP